jgi:hypothetical protein
MPTGRRVQPKKIPSGVAGVQYDTFQGSEIAFKGWWLNATKKARVPIPIFQHAFYPKLDHTPLDIRQHVIKRTITIPSLQDLHEHGIEAPRAFFVNEVLFDKRHIKNWNALRLTFPSFAKSIANRDDITFIFPANDNPSLRAKRKEVLQVLRANFTPLFLKGSHYTSGRMTFFFTAPKGAVQKFKRSFNFDEALKEKKANLEEFWAFNKTKKARRSYNRKPKAPSSSQSATATQIVAQTADKMEHELLPLTVSRLDLDPNSDAAHAMKDFLADPKTSRDLLKRTKGKTAASRFAAVKRWVREVFVPRAKEIIVDETVMAVEALGRFAFRTTIAIATNEVVGTIQTSEWGADKKFIQAFSYGPDMRPGTEIGAGTLSVGIKRNVMQEVQFQREVKARVLDSYKDMTGDTVSDYFLAMFKFRFSKSNKQTPVSISLNKAELEKVTAINPEAMGRFADEENEFDEVWFNHVNSRILPKLKSVANNFYRRGGD